MRASIFLAIICGLHLNMSCDSGTDPFSDLSSVFFFNFCVLISSVMWEAL